MRGFFLRYKTDESGQSLVEFAMVLLVLVPLLLGIIDFGMVFHSYVTVNTMAREGARQGVILKKDDGEQDRDSETVVDAILQVTPLLDKNKLTIKINNENAYEAGKKKAGFDLPSSSEMMTVEVIYNYNLITPLPEFVNEIANPLVLKGQITMVRE